MEFDLEGQASTILDAFNRAREKRIGAGSAQAAINVLVKDINKAVAGKKIW